MMELGSRVHLGSRHTTPQPGRTQELRVDILPPPATAGMVTGGEAPEGRSAFRGADPAGNGADEATRAGSADLVTTAPKTPDFAGLKVPSIRGCLAPSPIKSGQTLSDRTGVVRF